MLITAERNGYFGLRAKPALGLTDLSVYSVRVSIIGNLCESFNALSSTTPGIADVSDDVRVGVERRRLPR